jgi:hypothetical protein
MGINLPMPRLISFLHILFLTGLFTTGGCCFQSHADLARTIAAQGRLQPVVFHTSTFDIQGYQRFSKTESKLTIYLEGDGAAWKNRHSLATDPTPGEPTALSLAAQDRGGNVLYLARPCQYITTPACTSRYWSSHRYSPEIIQAVSQAIDQSKQNWQITDITLAGYSGGGVVAVLLAATRNDVSRVITIAANLDIDYWAKLHHVTPLSGSCNPCIYGDKLQYIQQIHIIGEDDSVVPVSVTKSYINCLPNPELARIITVPDADHHADWARLWPAILLKIRSGTIRPNSL